MKITVDLEEIKLIAGKADKLLLEKNTEKELAKLLNLQIQIEEAIKTAQFLIEQKGLYLNPNFKSVEGDLVKASYRAYGQKYYLEDDKIDKVPTEFYTKEVITKYKTNSDLIDKWVENNKGLPYGISAPERTKSLKIALKKTMIPRIKVSYTILNAWAQGKYEDAIKYLFRLEVIQTPAMKEGQEYHKRWEQEIQKTKKLPEVFGSKQLVDPSPEQYIKVDINDWLILSGKIDCYDRPTLYEFKTGRQTSEDVARSKQPGVYAVLSTLNKQYVDRAEIYCFNQHLKNDNKSMSIVYLTDAVLEDTLNWIETLAGEIRNYCDQNKLFEKYNQKL